MTGLSLYLAERPTGPLELRHLTATPLPVARLSPGTVLVRNRYAAIDPVPLATATRCWPLRSPVRAGPMIGEVIETRSADMPCGTLVLHHEGWATHSVLPKGGYLTRLIEPGEGVPVAAYLSVLGDPGLAGYVGLTKILALQPGEAVYIGAATDPVASAAAQLARLLGAACVIGGVDSPEAAAIAASSLFYDRVHEHGVTSSPRVDAALLTRGGSYLRDALALAREFGRLAWLDGASQGQGLAAPADLDVIHERSIRIEGFGIQHHRHLYKELEAVLAKKVRAGQLRPGRTADTEFSALASTLADVARSSNHHSDVYHIVV